jgi:hypothetical protein
MTVSGKVTEVRPEEDGDSHVYLALDGPPSTSLKLSSLLLEIVPADKPGCTPGKPPRPPSGSYDYGICTGANEADPAVGSHVTVTGPYVFDHNHGWNEIHPVWHISTATSAPAGGEPTPMTHATPSPISPTTTPARGGQNGVSIIPVTPSVDAGAGARLVAQTSPKASCDLAVTLPSGRHRTAQGLGPATADASGRVQWNWQTGNRTKSGTATATVTCGSASATTTFLFTR